MVDNKGVFPKSSLPSVQDYMEVFEPIIKQGKGIVCICITSKFSGSLQSATNAKNILLETYPDAKIEVIDSMVNTVLQGLFVLEAAKMCKAGVPMEACVNELLDMRESGRIFFTIGSIDYLKHGGRIGKLSGLAASVLGIKPLITLKDGEIYNSGVSRSRKASMAKVIELLKQYIEERKIDMKKIGSYVLDLVMTVKKLLHFKSSFVSTWRHNNRGRMPLFSDWSNNFSSYRSVSDWRWIY